MLRIVEVIGVSPDGFSEAVRAAVDRLLADGEDIHFFEVISQRGAIRDGKLKEYQVTVKVAVSDRKA